MRQSLSLLVGLLSLSGVFGCSSTYQVPEEYLDSRAQINFNAAAPAAGTYDTAELQDLVLKTIKADMLTVGKHPTNAIESAQLMSLESVAPNNSTGTSRANYSARVRINYRRHWIDVEYFVFERDGELKVSKTSLGL